MILKGERKMKKASISILAFILCTIMLAVPLCAIPAQALKTKEDAINLGLAWLANQQDPATGAWNLGYYSVASTAFALLKFEEYATKTLGMDPFSSAYEYSQNVTAGWNYIFGNTTIDGNTYQHAVKQTLDLQDGIIQILILGIIWESSFILQIPTRLFHTAPYTKRA